MLLQRAILLVCLTATSAFGRVATAQDLLMPAQDAPRYQLSNFRTENDRFGRQVMSLDFRRTREGKGSVSVSGKSASGTLSISASVPSSQDSGTIQLSSLFSSRGGPSDIELYFVQSHRIDASTTKYALVSNTVRMGNPGPASTARPWTAQERAMHAEFVRIMNDDSAHKPPKNYPVTTAVPDGSEFVPGTAKLVKGTRLSASYQDKWYPLTTISENDDGTINVRWDDYGATFDCSMIRGELVIETSLVNKLPKHPASRFPETVPNWASATAKTTLPVSPSAKPRKRYKVSIAVPVDSELVPQDLKLKAGIPLQACYAGKWNPITTLGENEDGTLDVRWDDYGPSFDCSMVREELIIKKQLAQQLRTDPSSVSIPRPAIAAKKRKAYPVSIAVPRDSQFVPADAKVTAGTRLQACWAGKWNPITALSENEDGSLNVRWDDFGPNFDCSMIREELIIKNVTLKELMATSSPDQTSTMRTWTDATGRFKVQAKLIDQSATQVTLQTEAGKQVKLPVSKLSEADQEFLRSIDAVENPFE